MVHFFWWVVIQVGFFFFFLLWSMPKGRGGYGWIGYGFNMDGEFGVLVLLGCVFFFFGNYTKPTCSLSQNHFAYSWFKKCHFTNLRYVLFVFCNPPLLKSWVNRYLCSNNILWPISIKYIIYTWFSHLICGFSAAYIIEGDPVQKMMLMKFINQMESYIELYWMKKRRKW